MTWGNALNIRHQDGSADDANYGAIGSGYVDDRRPTAQIAAVIGIALEDYGRPALLLDPLTRRACSACSFVDNQVVRLFSSDLERDLADSAWDFRHGHLRRQSRFSISLTLVIARQ